MFEAFPFPCFFPSLAPIICVGYLGGIAAKREGVVVFSSFLFGFLYRYSQWENASPVSRTTKNWWWDGVQVTGTGTTGGLWGSSSCLEIDAAADTAGANDPFPAMTYWRQLSIAHCTFDKALPKPHVCWPPCCVGSAHVYGGCAWQHQSASIPCSPGSRTLWGHVRSFPVAGAVCGCDCSLSLSFPRGGRNWAAGEGAICSLIGRHPPRLMLVNLFGRYFHLCTRWVS